MLQAWDASASDIPGVTLALVARAALQGDAGGSLPHLVRAAHNAAAGIRDRFSPDAWRALSDLVEAINAPLPANPSEGVLLDRVEGALRIVAAFSGLAKENMTRLAGWRFLELGRRIERGIATCRFIRQFSDVAGPEAELDVLLELCDSRITYRQRYIMVAARGPAIDLVALDPSNPRSVAYQLDRIEEHLAALPRHHSDGRLSPPQQIAAAAATALRTADAGALDAAAILGIEEALMRLSDIIAATYLSHSERANAQWEALA
jgi:uncharacterized alpha-E superfamily protein